MQKTESRTLWKLPKMSVRKQANKSRGGYKRWLQTRYKIRKELVR